MADTNWVQAATPVVAACIAGGVALHVSGVWRKQLVAKRRQEVAEEALLAAYNFEKALERIRWAVIPNQEAVDDNGERSDKLGTYYAVRRRIEKAKPELEALDRAVLLVDAHFGRHVSRPLRDLQLMLDRVYSANSRLAAYEAEGKEMPDHSVFMRLKRDRTCLDTPEFPDEISRKANAAMHLAEANLKKHLRLPGEFDPEDTKAPWHIRLVETFRNAREDMIEKTRQFEIKRSLVKLQTRLRLK